MEGGRERGEARRLRGAQEGADRETLRERKSNRLRAARSKRKRETMRDGGRGDRQTDRGKEKRGGGGGGVNRRERRRALTLKRRRERERCSQARQPAFSTSLATGNFLALFTALLLNRLKISSPFCQIAHSHYSVL